MRCAWHIARIGQMRNVYSILVGKSEGKRPLRRATYGLEDIIKPYVKEIGWEAVDWVLLVQDRDQWRSLVNTIMDIRAP